MANEKPSETPAAIEHAPAEPPTAHQRACLRAVTGLDDVTIKALYMPTPGRGVREASYHRACEGAEKLGMAPPPPPNRGVR